MAASPTTETKRKQAGPKTPAQVWLLWDIETEQYVVASDGGGSRLAYFTEQDVKAAANEQFDLWNIRTRPVRVF